MLITRKNPTVEGIKIPYLFNVDEYLLELEDSFSEKKVLGISTSVRSLVQIRVSLISV